MQLVFATNNMHKFKEVRKLLPVRISLLTLRDIGCEDSLPETGSTLHQNALQKARYVHDKYGLNCFADDSGLEVAALGGRPGVYSARFAGPSATSTENIDKLLIEMKGIQERAAEFVTVIALLLDSKEYFFDGRIAGRITEKTFGSGGFGYDPVFMPSDSDSTFSEMSDEQKNAISHRAIAIQKLTDFLARENF